MPKVGPTFREGREIIMNAHGWGMWERIRRRNRQLWARLLGKARRADDKRRTEESVDVAM